MQQQVQAAGSRLTWCANKQVASLDCVATLSEVLQSHLLARFLQLVHGLDGLAQAMRHTRQAAKLGVDCRDAAPQLTNGCRSGE